MSKQWIKWILDSQTNHVVVYFVGWEFGNTNGKRDNIEGTSSWWEHYLGNKRNDYMSLQWEH